MYIYICVCVWHICIDAKLPRFREDRGSTYCSFSCRGRQGRCMAVANEAPCSWLGYGVWSTTRTCRFSDIARGQAQNPKHNDFISSRLPQSVFSPKPCRRCILIILPKPCRRCILWLFWKTIAETLFSTDIILCIVNMLVLSNFVESGLNSVWQHWMLYIVFEKYYKGLYCKSNGLGWFARFRTQFLPDHYNDPFLSSVWL